MAVAISLISLATAGPIYTYSIPAGGYAPNGNLLSYSDCVSIVIGSPCVTSTWGVSYDHLNRVSGGISSAGPWSGLSLGWLYDSFGNRSTQTVSATSPPSAGVPQSQTLNFASANNRIGNYGPSGYDTGGNVVNDLINQYAYDAEGRVCAVVYPSGLSTGYMQYIYDGEGRRVAKGSIQAPALPLTAAACNATTNGFAQTEGYVLGQSGEQVSEVDGSGNFLRSHVYANGQLLATYWNNSTEFAFNDWVGTKRVVADSNGNVSGGCINLPFGDELICDGNVSLGGHHFTGKERDSESGLDYFGARYYGSSMGRFMSPDWGSVMGDSIPDPVPYADFTNPQSLNLYTYGYNNPLSNKDADGHDVSICDNNNNCHTVSNEDYQKAQQGNNGSLNVPSLNQVGMNGNGSGQFNATNITDANGNSVGTATYVSNGGADYYANRTGIDFINTQTAPVVNTMAGITIGAVGLIGGAEIAAAAPEAGGLIQQAGGYRRFLSLRSAWTALSKATGAAGLIGTFFKTGQVPPGLTPEMMQSYLSLARAYIAAGLGGAAGLAEQTSRAEQLSQYLGK